MAKKIISILLLCSLLLATGVLAQRATDLQVSLTEYHPRPVQPGQTFDFVLEINNVGNPAKGTWLEIVEEDPFLLEDSQDFYRAQDLGLVTSRQELQFRVSVNQDAKDGIYPLRVRFGTEGNHEIFREEVFDINIETFDAHLHIEKVVQLPSEIVPGEKGKIMLTITNYEDQVLKNLDIVLDLTHSFDLSTNMNNMVSVQAMINAKLEDINRRIASGMSPLEGPSPMMAVDKEKGEQGTTDFKAFAPIGTATQKRINAIQPKETKVIEFEVMALPNIKPNMYAVPVFLNYNDEDNNPFHLSTDIGIKVNMEPKIHLELEETTLRSVDFSGKLNIKVANRGLSDLNYVTLNLEESEDFEVLTAPNEIYLGNLAAGEAQTGIFEVIAEKENIEIPLTATYRDSFNKEHETKTKLKLRIINKNYYRNLSFEMWLAWLILGGVMLVLAALYFRKTLKER